MIHIVIGTNYGDEGKGMSTAYLTQYQRVVSGKTPIIVRYSGGAQSGHTVNGIVHHQVGSGNGDTYLHKTFLVNFLLLQKEVGVLTEIGQKPGIIWINENAGITTPYDVFINQVKETLRGDGRHGSCGLGIWESVSRPEKLTVWDLYNLNYGTVEEKASGNYKRFMQSLKDSGVSLPEQFQDIDIKAAFRDYIRAANDLLNSKVIRVIKDTKDSLNGILEGKDLIFESSQGLKIDPDLGDSNQDYNTPTSVSSYIPLLLVSFLGRTDEIRTWYVTRTFFTRHGNGPFPTEDATLCDKFSDATNKPNEWQGTLRMGTWDKAAFESSISSDRAFYKRVSNKARVGYAITYGVETDFKFLTKSGLEDLEVENTSILLFNGRDVKSGRVFENYSGEVSNLATYL